MLANIAGMYGDRLLNPRSAFNSFRDSKMKHKTIFITLSLLLLIGIWYLNFWVWFK